MIKKQNMKYYVAFSIALITFALYIPALQNDFVDNWDDNVYVIDNAHIRSLDFALLRFSFFGFLHGNWHPLTVISHATDYAVWGLNPLGHHLTNNILHAANTFLVVLLVIKLLSALKQATIKKSSRLWTFATERAVLITAGTTGLLFGLHPVHVESVAWIAERKDLLCALFFLLSIIAYANYVLELNDKTVQKKALPFILNKRYLLTILFFILALLSKPMAVTLPIVLLILDWYPFNRIQSGKTFQVVLIEKIPLIALSFISSILAVLAQEAVGALMPFETVPLSTRILVGTKALIMYLWNMAWPMNLIPLYSYNPKRVSFGSLEYSSAVVLVAVFSVASMIFVKKQRLWPAIWGYYVVTLLPVLGIVQVGGQLMADRYTYLPSLGPFLIMGLFTAWITEEAKTGKWVRPIVVACGTVAFIILVFLSYLTVKQIAVWKNSITLWSCVIDTQSHPYPYPFKQRIQSFHKKGQWREEIQDYNAVIFLDPSDSDAYYNRGVVFQKMGKLDSARKDYDTAIAMQPVFPEAYNNRGVLNIALGLFDKAVDDLSRSIAMNPHRADVYNSRGFAYFSMHQHQKALKDFNASLHVDPNYVMAYLNRGRLYLSTGQRELARADFRKACELGDNGACNASR